MKERTVKIKHHDRNSALKKLADLVFFTAGAMECDDANMFFIALLGVNMKKMPLADALIRSALDRDEAFHLFEKEKYNQEKIGEIKYSAEYWITHRYAYKGLE